MLAFKPKLSALFSQGTEFLHRVEKANGESSCCKGSYFPHILSWGVVCRVNRCTYFFFRFLTHLKEGNLFTSQFHLLLQQIIFFWRLSVNCSQEEDRLQQQPQKCFSCEKHSTVSKKVYFTALWSWDQEQMEKNERRLVCIVRSNMLYMEENYYCGYFRLRFTERLSPLYPCVKCNPCWSGVYRTMICKFMKGPPFCPVLPQFHRSS